MFEPSTTRRQLLRTGCVTASAVALAGCFGSPGGADGTSTPRIDRVPAGTRFLLHADVSALLADDVLRSRIDALVGADGPFSASGYQSLSEALTDFERTAGLDPLDVSDTLIFAGSDPGADAAAILWSEWSESAVREAIGSVGLETEPDIYREHAIYHLAGETELGVLGSGTYVVGTPGGVAAAIDLDAGETEAVGGLVRQGFGDAAAGAVRTSFAIPDALAGVAGSDAPVDGETVRAVTHGYGVYTDSGEDPVAVVTIETERADAAGRLADGLRTALSRLRELANSDRVREAVATELIPMLDSIAISRRESAVRLEVGRGEDALTVGFALLGSLLLGLGSRPARNAPQAIFEFEFDPDTMQLAIAHHGGDVIRADELAIRGSGFADVAGVDMTAPGYWQGSASGEVDGRPGVVAGDVVTVGAAADYSMRVVWEDADGDRSSLLATDSGPAA